MPGHPRTTFASIALSIALIGCASKPASTPPPKPSPPSIAPTPSAAAASAPNASSPPASRSTRSSKATSKSKKTTAASAPPPPTPRQPGVAKADRNFLRPSSGTVAARFDGRGSKGVDFTGTKGDPVYASRDGKIVYAAGGLRGYGQLVMIKHDAHYVTAYAHNSQLLVKEGQAVKRGQMIARMGSSDADRVKLHFELRRDGRAVDPLPYLSADEAP